MFGLRSLPGLPWIDIEMRPPELCGSGKSLMPWLRMHWDTLRAFCSAWACWALVGGGPILDWHAFDAALKVGLLGLIPDVAPLELLL